MVSAVFFVAMGIIPAHKHKLRVLPVAGANSVYTRNDNNQIEEELCQANNLHQVTAYVAK